MIYALRLALRQNQRTPVPERPSVMGIAVSEPLTHDHAGKTMHLMRRPRWVVDRKAVMTVPSAR